MKLKIGDYLIETDERQFIVKTKKVVEESRLAKEENIGKEYWQPVAYCITLDSALKFIPQQVIRSNNDVSIIIGKLEQIEEIIKVIPQPIKIEIEKTVVKKEKVEEDSITISKEEYEQLLGKEKLLECLEAVGVDNWGGWDDAMEMIGGEDNE